MSKKTKSPRRAAAADAAPARAAAGPHESFQHPLASRYASAEMLALWSPQRRHGTWRRIWVALAESQRALGLPIREEQIRALRAAVDDIDFAKAAQYERATRHDVMAHIRAFGDAAPAAAGVIHLGATSMDIVDNADLLLTRDALGVVCGRLAAAANKLADFCERYADLPTLGYTHLQPAQLTTVGKRATLWLQDLVRDVQQLESLRRGLLCRGLRGATGTQASFLALLGSAAKVEKLETLFARKLGFAGCYSVCGQTYSRKIDVEIVNALSSFAAGVMKICNDLRMLQMLKEIEEPFEREQVGSSAMPYKRNPARAERATGLARYLLSLAANPLMTLSDQGFERTLDDSANKRLVFPEAFLCADAIAIILDNVFDGLVVYPEMIRAHLAAELPFIATENILMAAARAGGDRQELHERLRVHSHAAGEQVKKHGRANDLIERLRADAAFAGVRWERVLAPEAYVGLAPRQTRRYVAEARRALRAVGATAGGAVELRV